MDINFFSQCENMTYIPMNEDNKLFQVCKGCSHTEEFKEYDSIYNMSTDGIDISEVHNTNKYITHDITLPSITKNDNIKCINTECTSHSKDTNSRITYIKYDTEDMKYLYICNHCGTSWKNI